MAVKDREMGELWGSERVVLMYHAVRSEEDSANVFVYGGSEDGHVWCIFRRVLCINLA